MDWTEFTEFLKTEPKEEPKECKGLVFRYVRETWVGASNDINFRDRFRLLKHKSCNHLECDACGFLWDDMRENIGDIEYCSIDYDANQFTHDQLYKLIVIPGDPDWESGYVEDWSLRFISYKEES